MIENAAIDRALKANATRSDDGGWYFVGSWPVHHTDEQARGIAELCLLLDVPVTDTISTEKLLTLVRRLVRAEDLLNLLLVRMESIEIDHETTTKGS